MSTDRPDSAVSPAPSAGEQRRRQVMGDAFVDRALGAADAFSKPLQAYVNDPTEGQRLRKFCPPGKANPLAVLYEGIEKPNALTWQGKDFHVFVACFSLQPDSLNLWRFYGRNGAGFSIVRLKPENGSI